MKTKSIFLVVLCLFAQSYYVSAQREADNVISFDEDIESILLNFYTGSVIVKGENNIQSYNPDTNEIEWSVSKDDLVKANITNDVISTIDMINSAGNGDISKMLESKKDEIYFISESPFISLVLNDYDLILNSVDGKVVFNSANEGYRVMKAEYMPQEQAFLLMVVNNKKYNCVYHDLQTGTQKWMTELATTESFFKSLGSLFTSDALNEDKVVTTSDFIYASINGELYKIQKSDGTLLWKPDFKITNFYLSKNESNLITTRVAGNILSTKMALNLLDANTGTKLWKDDISTKYISYLEDAGDKVLVAHAKGFNFFNYSDGKKVWKKDAKGNNIKQVIPIGEDYLYIADKEMNLIDKNGQNKWKKFIEICDNDEDQVYYLGLVDNNRVFYLTDTYGNMVDYSSGKKIWKKNIEFDKKRPLLYGYDESKNVYLVYNDKKLYKFDPNATEKPEAFAKLKKINNDKTMSDIELFDWGVSLVGQNDVVGVTFDGETKYHNTYKEPGGNRRKLLGIGRKVAMTGVAAYAGVNTMKMGFGAGTDLMGATNGSADKAYDNVVAASNIGTVLGSSALDKFEQRFNALKHNNEYAFVFAKNEETGKPQLVKVRKSDGEEVDKISIDGTKPLYEVDSYNDNLYYVNKNELRIYNKK